MAGAFHKLCAAAGCYQALSNVAGLCRFSIVLIPTAFERLGSDYLMVIENMTITTENIGLNITFFKAIFLRCLTGVKHIRVIGDDKITSATKPTLPQHSRSGLIVGNAGSGASVSRGLGRIERAILATFVVSKLR